MRNKLSKTLLIIIAIIIGYYLSGYFGYLYNLLPNTYNGAWIGSNESWSTLLGLPLSLIFFLVLVSHKFVFEKKSSVLWLISPLLLLEVGTDISHIYFPIILILIGFALNKMIRKIFIRNSNPSITIK